MPVVVERSDPSLAPDLARLQLTAAVAGYRDIFPSEAPPPTEEELGAQWAEWLAGSAHRVLIALDGEVLVGMVLAGPDLDEPGAGHLARLYVDPSRWGLGIGRQLYDAAVTRLRGAGHATATLWVLERNERARGWYERLGWQITGERKPVYAPAGIDDVRYRIVFASST